MDNPVGLPPTHTHTHAQLNTKNKAQEKQWPRWHVTVLLQRKQLQYHTSNYTGQIKTMLSL